MHDLWSGFLKKLLSRQLSDPFLFSLVAVGVTVINHLFALVFIELIEFLHRVLDALSRLIRKHILHLVNH